MTMILILPRRAMEATRHVLRAPFQARERRNALIAPRGTLTLMATRQLSAFSVQQDTSLVPALPRALQ